MMRWRGLAVVGLLGTVAACSAILGIDVLPASGGANQSDASSDSSASDDGSTGDGAVNDRDGSVNPNAPRLLAPLSTSHVTSRTPTLHWVLPSGVTDVTLDLCHDRACTIPIALGIPVHGSQYNAYSGQLPTGVVFWRTHAGTNTSPTWEFWVGARSALVDTSWGTTLDVNGDGRPDVAIGDGQQPGGVTIHLGIDGGIATAAATSLTTSSFQGAFGGQVSSAGDVNGDGYGDLLVADIFQTQQTVFVYLGSPSGIPSKPVAVLRDGSGIKGFGRVLPAGDINGDGYADIAFTGDTGATGPHTDAGFPAATGINILFGSAGAFSANVRDGGFAADQTLLDPSGATGRHGDPAFGFVTATGDFNGDGLGDLAAWSQSFPDGGNSGSPFVGDTLYLFKGSDGGVVPTPYVTFVPSTPTFSPTLSTVADFNGDGYGDVFTSGDDGYTALFKGNSYFAGAIQSSDAGTLMSSNGCWMTGDLNGDGFADGLLSSGDGLDPIFGVSLGVRASAPVSVSLGNGYFQSGPFVSAAGDVDGDGFGDVWMAIGSAPPTIGLFNGSLTGLATAPDGGLVPSLTLQGATVFGSTN